jgi:ABC-type sulfate/molybdate transport systems ATPase subunit
VAVVVTHDARVFDFADRIVTLEDGRVAATKRGERVVPSSPLTPLLDPLSELLGAQAG